MIRQCLAFILLFFAAVLIDMAWFTLVTGSYYLEALGPILRQTESGFQFDILTAVIVYMLLVLGILLFVLPRANRNSSKAAWWGAIYGVIIYGIYDLTNYSTINGWPLNLSMLDIGWGVVYCSILSTLAVFLQKRWNL